MIALSRKFFSRYIPKQFCRDYQRQQPVPATESFIPFSQVQQERELLESQLVYTLHGCTDLNEIKQVHAHVLRKRVDQCCYVLTKLIRMLTEVNVPMEPYPRLIFDQVKNRNPFLYTALIRGYAFQGHFTESVLLYGSMRREGIGPVSFTFSALFKLCRAVSDVNLGRQIHAQKILIGGFLSDLYVGNSMIDMYVKSGFLDCGRKVFEEMPNRDVISWTELIVAYAKSGIMESAGELFDGMPAKDMVAWTAMVTGFAQNAKPREAIEYFERMQEAGVNMDDVTLAGVISACAQLGAAKYADWIRDIAEESGLGPGHSVVVGSGLIDMYSKCGCVEDAYKVFTAMKEKNVFSYSSMILGFAMHGHAKAALQLFHEMVKTETRPNKVTFIGVLTACSHTGMIEQGWQIFESMEKCYGVEPSADHYACMVDLLGRAGRLDEALDLANTMPVKPNGGVWGALLGACQIHRNPDIAQIAANHLFELEPNSIGNYILLSNIYSSAGRRDEVLRVRKLVREKNIQKNPGCSWVEVDKGVTLEFFAGDMSSEIKLALDELLDRLHAIGYQPMLNSVVYDVCDEEKKRILMTHSEKQALTFVLIRQNSGCAIRIMKNMRTCEDCHLFMCAVSQLTGREIVMRDNMRFHHFRGGKCSCGNFW